MSRACVVLLAIVLAGTAAVAPMAMADTTPPAAITDLTIAYIGPHTAVLTWTATGDDGTTGTATSYRLVYASGPITDIHQSGLTVVQTFSPLPSGYSECASVEGLSPSHPYTFAIIAIDEEDNEGSLGNTPGGGTPWSGEEYACS